MCMLVKNPLSLLLALDVKGDAAFAAADNDHGDDNDDDCDDDDW